MERALGLSSGDNAGAVNMTQAHVHVSHNALSEVAYRGIDLFSDNISLDNISMDNASNNSYNNEETIPRPFVHILSTGIDVYVVPIIIVLGLLGNTLSFVVFVRTNLRTLSSSVYLAALAISDNGFLLCVLASWLTNVNVNLYHRFGWCQAFVYLSYVFSSLSVWYIVGFTVERYIAVCFPFKRSEMCTERRAKGVVISMALFALVAYNFAVWTSDAQLTNSIASCHPLPKYEWLVQTLNNVDTVVTLIVPSLSIVIINVRIGHQILTLQNQRKKILSWSDSDTSMFERLTKRSAFQNSQVTKMLLVVSSIFLILNFPSHAIRVHQFFMRLFAPEYVPSRTYIELQRICQYIYYINFSINVLLYSLCGKNFRMAMWTLLRGTKLGGLLYGDGNHGLTAVTHDKTSPEREAMRMRTHGQQGSPAPAAKLLKG